ncbi:lysozyme inhibitor LprI family protein [Shewanella halifaxensis]|uniref:lysozyme inhibitor LprI family protein n=1 Tax=Shewanella halifaxensis TaxID=271098 RepID=UPI000D58E8F0|nr:lysozyme inhibitor LprI family protein [Shewanella halifaxensis]
MTKLLVLLLSFTSFQLFAQGDDEDCQFSESLCGLQASFAAADKELNDVYKSINNRIKSGELSESTLVDAAELKQSLLNSQRSWLKFKESNCDAFYVLQSGGSQRNEARMECEIEMTKARTNYLKSWY